MNAVQRKPVETTVLNPTASEASYKLKQRSYRKTNLKKRVLVLDNPGAEMSIAESVAPKYTRPEKVCAENAHSNMQYCVERTNFFNCLGIIFGTMVIKSERNERSTY